MMGLKRIFAFIFAVIMLVGFEGCNLQESPTTPGSGSGQIGGNGDGYSGLGNTFVVPKGKYYEWIFTPTDAARTATDITEIHVFNLPDSSGKKQIRVEIVRGTNTEQQTLDFVTANPELWDNAAGTAIKITFDPDGAAAFDMVDFYIKIDDDIIDIALDKGAVNAIH